jgi:hypothetical protein
MEEEEEEEEEYARYVIIRVAKFGGATNSGD